MYHSLATRLIAAFFVSLVFSLVARALHGVSVSGAVAGGLVCFVLYAAAGPPALFALLVLFILTWAGTRAGSARKETSGIAEQSDGRTASQVLANLAVAAICTAIYALKPGHPGLLLMLSAALSEPAADTVSSEIGKAGSRKARLVTTWAEVPAGTDGGVTLTGSIAGAIAAVITTAAFFFSSGSLPRSWAIISVISAIGGMLADSYLGASLERRHLLNNDAVNFISTGISVLIAAVLLSLAG